MSPSDVISKIYEKGEYFLKGCKNLVEKYKVPATVSGIPPMPFITFDKVDDKYKERRTRFYTETIRRNLFIQPYHYGYIAFRHTDDDLDQALKAIEEAFEVISKKY